MIARSAIKNKRGSDHPAFIFKLLAERYHWTPAQVRAQDPDDIDALLIFLNEEGKDAQRQQRKLEREQKGKQRGQRR